MFASIPFYALIVSAISTELRATTNLKIHKNIMLRFGKVTAVTLEIYGAVTMLKKDIYLYSKVGFWVTIYIV